ncbi:hypothetical protein BDR04DRAFT_934087, partial [Suillus decipiens]
DLFHGCWNRLLDAEFLCTYRHGIVIKCPDRLLGQVYPCIFTYSADYLKKVLIAMIKDMGSCPCQCCLMQKSSFEFLGLSRDMQ